MDDVKHKLKGFMKKVNNQFPSSTSGKFKGQGRVLGSAEPPPFSGSNYTVPVRHDPRDNEGGAKNYSSSSNSKLMDQRYNENQKEVIVGSSSTSHRRHGDGLDPFETLITSSKVSKNGFSLNLFECPICGVAYRTEEEVSEHVDYCASKRLGDGDESGIHNKSEENPDSELEATAVLFLSDKSRKGSDEILLKLIRNVAKEPENSKFRKIRMGNPKIKEAITEVAGGIELLKLIGFEIREEDGELWAIMENTPSEREITLLNKVANIIDRKKVEEDNLLNPKENVQLASSVKDEEEKLPQNIDRQIRVFFSVPESVAARIELPDSFYNLSIDEIKREAEGKKKRIEESQLLIPKSYKAKQAEAMKTRYRRTLIRVQFPDGVVLQGVFAPWESVTVLYEFVSSALEDPSLQFELLDPVMVKRRTIPHSHSTLQAEGLVPSALIKFRHVESDSSVFTGLCNELLEISEPLTIAKT